MSGFKEGISPVKLPTGGPSASITPFTRTMSGSAYPLSAISSSFLIVVPFAHIFSILAIS